MFKKIKNLVNEIKEKNNERENRFYTLVNQNIDNMDDALFVLNNMKFNTWYNLKINGKIWTINKERDGEFNIKGIKKDYYKNELIVKVFGQKLPKDKHGNYLKG